MQSELPLVSAVIPTHRRPKQVIRATESVLRQTYSPIEVIVVIDGLDHDTRAAVEALRHPSVTCLETGHHVGPAEARNMESAPPRASISACWMMTMNGRKTKSPHKWNLSKSGHWPARNF